MKIITSKCNDFGNYIWVICENCKVRKLMKRFTYFDDKICKCNVVNVVHFCDNKIILCA